jgi:imidazolonepropionase-like amidohydrolase
MKTKSMGPIVLFSLLVLLTTLGAVWALAQNRPAQRPAAAPGLLVLRGGLLIDGTGSAPAGNPVVIISDGKIQSVGREGSVTIPADATVIDTTGKTILPGLIDAHIHLRNFAAPGYLYWGVTSIGDLGNATGWIVAYREAVASGRAAGPYIMAAGAKVNPPPGPGDALSSGDAGGLETFTMGNSQMAYVTDQVSAAKVMANFKKEGVDAVKLYSRMPPALMKIAAQEAHRQGFRVFAHYPNTVGMDEIFDTGINVNVHLNGLLVATAPKEIRDRFKKGEIVPAAHLLDTSKFPALAKDMVARNIMINPSLERDGSGMNMPFASIGKRHAEFDRLNAAYVQTPLISVLPEFIRQRYAATFKSPQESAEKVREREEGFRRVSLFLKEFVDQGGKIMAGSDSGSSMPAVGLTLHEEMALMTEAGLTPMQVIQSATSWASEAWGKSKEAGTVQAGKRADILILNRNPLDDMSATTDIYRVIQGGKIVDREGLAKRWDADEAVIRPMPMQTGGIPNFLVHVPFIHELSPDLISMKRKNPSELTLSGRNFSKDSLVLINDRLVQTKAAKEDELQVSIPSELMKKQGVYPLVVVQPGSGGAVSNTMYLIVTPD